MLHYARQMLGRTPTAPSGAVTTYSYTGATEEITIGAGITSLAFKLWGAGGSGGIYEVGNKGGGGGFTTGSVSVTAGDVIRIQVAQGGRYPPTSQGGAGGWPDGGSGTVGDTQGGGGGGSSRIWKNGTLMAVAGGGGGGGGYGGASNGHYAGAGGGSSGQDSAAAGGGRGGSQIAGGIDGDDFTFPAAKKGLQISTETNRTGAWGGITADTTTPTGDDGGGGGGGYWGGGGGGGDGNHGGGGSGFLHASVTGSTTAGSAEVPAGTGDTNYPGGSIAYGSPSSVAAAHGHDGFVRLSTS